MPQVQPIHAIRYATPADRDLSHVIAPPYDVLDEAGKERLLDGSPHNIVAIDLPHLPAKTVGPDPVYEQAGHTFRQWLDAGVLVQQAQPTVYVYQQTYTAPHGPGGGGHYVFKRRGLIANVRVQPFGQNTDGQGAIHPHEQTFSGPKEDRMKLMCATRAQLSPIFGLYSDPTARVQPLLEKHVNTGPPSFFGVTENDQVRHEVWEVRQAEQIQQLCEAIAGLDTFIADGHHRYNTALNYRQRLVDAGQLNPNGTDQHPANQCLFVLVAMQDPGMIVLPTHRVLGGMAGFSLDRLILAGQGKIQVNLFAGSDLESIENALPTAGVHAMGLYDPANPQAPLAIMTPVESDPLAQTHPNASPAWRQLDVAILQHLIVEQICQAAFYPAGSQVIWKFPHTLPELKSIADSDGFQAGVVMQPTPLESVRKISESGELMPQKSTFFYPKLATGLVMNPLG